MTKVHFTIREELLPDSGSKMDKLVMWFNEQAHYATYEPQDIITVAYLEYVGKEEDGSQGYNVCNSEVYPAADMIRAIKAFNERLVNPHRVSSINGQLEQFGIKSADVDEFPSHQYINRDQARPHLVYLARRINEAGMPGYADDLYAISRLFSEPA